MHSRHSRLAHEGAKFSRDYRLENVYHTEVFKAQFEREEDISSLNVLSDAARNAGLPQKKFSEAILSRQYRAEVDRDILFARECEVYAVPTFIYKNRFLTGVHPVERLRELVSLHQPWPRFLTLAQDVS